MKIIERIDQVDTGMGLGKEEDSSSFMTSDARIRCGSGGGGVRPSLPSLGQLLKQMIRWERGKSKWAIRTGVWEIKRGKLEVL